MEKLFCSLDPFTGIVFGDFGKCQFFWCRWTATVVSEQLTHMHRDINGDQFFVRKDNGGYYIEVKHNEQQ